MAPHEQPSASRRRSGAARWDRARRAAAATLAATFIVLVPIAVASAWIRGTVLSTSGYVAAISNIAANPAVRTVIREAVTAEASALLPRAGGALPDPLSTVTPINTATNTALPPIKTGSKPLAIAVTPNGTTVYVVNELSNTVTPIRTATNKALRPIKVGSLPLAIAITP